MTDGTHRKISKDNPRRLKRIVIGLAVIYVMTFVSGFLQATQYILFQLHLLFPLVHRRD